MNRNYLPKLVLILLVLVWSIYELYPPNDRDLVQVFRERAVNRDTNFTQIIERVQTLQKTNSVRTYGNLKDAIGTNDLTRYFPFFDTKTELNPHTYILNRLQREAAGRIRLGIDLKGGTSFLLRMDTNRLEQASDIKSALSQAVEVLRKRVDKFGVAEPVIQPEGNNRILIQLPGLSEAVKESAKETIQKVAFLEFRLVHEDSRNLLEQGATAPGYEVLTHIKTLPSGAKQAEKYLVKKKPEMTGGIKSAMVTRDNLGQPQIAFTLDPAAADTFGRITRENV